MTQLHRNCTVHLTLTRIKVNLAATSKLRQISISLGWSCFQSLNAILKIHRIPQASASALIVQHRYWYFPDARVVMFFSWFLVIIVRVKFSRVSRFNLNYSTEIESFIRRIKNKWNCSHLSNTESSIFNFNKTPHQEKRCLLSGLLSRARAQIAHVSWTLVPHVDSISQNPPWTQ